MSEKNDILDQLNFIEDECTKMDGQMARTVRYRLDKVRYILGAGEDPTPRMTITTEPKAKPLNFRHERAGRPERWRR